MGERKPIDVASSVIAAIRSSKNGKSMEIKELRTASLAACDLLTGSEPDKSAKKLFKSAVKSLEKDRRVSLSSDGIVKLSKSERAGVESADGGSKSISEKKKKKKGSKRKRQPKGIAAALGDEDEDVENAKKTKSAGKRRADDDDQNNKYSQKGDDNDAAAEEEDHDPKDKNKPCRDNPRGCTRLFLGNLPFAVTEPGLNAHLGGCVTHVKWITDKETGRFYGSAFVEVRDSRDAARAVSRTNGAELMGRPIRINYAPPKAGEERDWPPRHRVITGGKAANQRGGQAGGAGVKAMSEKPEGCCKLFVGNLSYDIDDETINKFFMAVEAEVKSVRWIHHQDNGHFKGIGFIDFWNTEACEKAATLNGKNLLGRPIRIDWAD